jgi:hypothetical protein
MKKSMLKKLLACVIITSMVLGSTLTVFATDPTVEVLGSIEATIIDVTLPISLSFAVNPNAKTALGEKVVTATPATITNSTNAPVDVQVLGIVSDVGTDAKVVERLKYTPIGWDSLGKNATISNIALGVKQASIPVVPTIWSPAEVPAILPNVSVGTVSLDRLGTKDISIDVLHGFAWDTAKTLNYKLYLRLALTE